MIFREKTSPRATFFSIEVTFITNEIFIVARSWVSHSICSRVKPQDPNNYNNKYFNDLQSFKGLSAL